MNSVYKHQASQQINRRVTYSVCKSGILHNSSSRIIILSTSTTKYTFGNFGHRSNNQPQQTRSLPRNFDVE